MGMLTSVLFIIVMCLAAILFIIFGGISDCLKSLFPGLEQSDPTELSVPPSHMLEPWEVTSDNTINLQPASSCVELMNNPSTLIGTGKYVVKLDPKIVQGHVHRIGSFIKSYSGGVAFKVDLTYVILDISEIEEIGKL